MKIRLLPFPATPPPLPPNSWRPSLLTLSRMTTRVTVTTLVACSLFLVFVLSPTPTHGESVLSSQKMTKNYKSIGAVHPPVLHFSKSSKSPLGKTTEKPLPCAGEKCRRRRKSSKTSKTKNMIPILFPSSPSTSSFPSGPVFRKISDVDINNISSVIDQHPLPSTTPIDLKSLAKSAHRQRKECKSGKKTSGFSCRRVGWISWLIAQLDRSTATLLHPWVELVKNPELSENVSLSESELMPENWPEEKIFRLLQRYGEPMDKLLFYKYKEFTKSRELRVKVPKLFEVKVSPRTHAVAETGRSTPRIFWDPGFNLKLKLPFFKDELKVAISTGPSFLAGIGTGIVLLIIKGMFAPFLFGMKYMIYNIFWKEGSPWEMMKMIWGGSGHRHGPEPWESAAPPPSIEHYEPPLVHNAWDNHHHQHHGPPQGPPGSGHGYGWGGGTNDQKLQFSQLNPILQGLSSSEGRRQHFKSLLGGGDNFGLTGSGSGGVTGSGFGGSSGSESMVDNHVKDYVPSHALQAEVENYDPFYSPLLSRIDSIYTHLGYHDEGCRERAVCSIYKFPVKYAPYSNLLSAQLSKHQSELKRPVTKSPRILRYFKYMKAAKDGQGQASCIDMYPNCDADTDSVTNLPMITTFNQLSELMGAEANGPSGS